MIDTSTIREHTEVVGSDGQYVGRVDSVEGDAIKLTRRDKDAAGQHHWLPTNLIASVGDAVRLNVPASEAKAQWETIDEMVEDVEDLTLDPKTAKTTGS